MSETNSFTQQIILGIGAFLATNIDDIFLLILLLLPSNSVFSKNNIRRGQYLGFTVLLLASLPGFWTQRTIKMELLGLLGFLPLIMGVIQLIKSKPRALTVQTMQEISDNESFKTAMYSALSNILGSQTYAVAVLTIANGGDNIAFYVPLFAHYNLYNLVLHCFIFYIMIEVLYYIADQITQNNYLYSAQIISRYSQIIIAIVWIGLGIFILRENYFLS